MYGFTVGLRDTTRVFGRARTLYAPPPGARAGCGRPRCDLFTETRGRAPEPATRGRCAAYRRCMMDMARRDDQTLKPYTFSGPLTTATLHTHTHTDSIYTTDRTTQEQQQARLDYLLIPKPTSLSVFTVVFTVRPPFLQGRCERFEGHMRARQQKSRPACARCGLASQT